MEILGQTPVQTILFIVIYTITGVVPLMAALYLLLRRGNAFAPDTMPPVRLRRWAAAFFAISALGHVWWLLFCVLSSDIHSADDMFRSMGYVVAVMLDWVTLLPTAAGTLLAMLQNRRRPIWPVFVAMIPIVATGGVLMVSPNARLMQIAVAYIVLLYVLFTVYVTFAVRQYGRWLRDNYADLEHKEVWFTHVVSLVFMLLLIFYALVDTNTSLLYLLHFIELVLFGLLLWRVETLPTLDENSLTPDPSRGGEGSEYSQGGDSAAELSTPLPTAGGVGGGAFDLNQIDRLLAANCVDAQLYLRPNLTLQQLAQAVGTNRSYLSQYFSRQGITYYIYINNLRVNHFISRYEEATAAGQSVVAQELAYESGFRSYSTFSRAFTERMGKSVTAWMGQSTE
jgi:AraC-like DNA-binding protein